MVGQALQGSFELSPLVTLSCETSPKQHHKVHGEPCSLSGVIYPDALATHSEVVADKDLFYDTLNKFHAALGTRLMIPTIGGKELDLHVFYIEVSARGGFEQVVKDRKWKEITVAFDFPPTTTSASFVLRKYYIMLLHHYEQVYYFGSKGQVVPPAVPLTGSSPVSTLAANGVATTELQEGENKMKRSGALDMTRVQKVDLGGSVGSTVSGLIDGKFEHGYLVSVNVGSDLLRGVLYHIPPGSVCEQFAMVPNVINRGGGNTTAVDARRRRRRRRKDEMPKKDPHAPKPNRSGYNFFFQEQHMQLRSLHPDKDREISRLIGESWNKLTDEERAVYQELGVKDKERYKKEMDDYRKRLKSQIDCEASATVRGDGSSHIPSSLGNVQEKHKLSLGEVDSYAEKTDCKFSIDDFRFSDEAERELLPGPTFNHF